MAINFGITWLQSYDNRLVSLDISDCPYLVNLYQNGTLDDTRPYSSYYLESDNFQWFSFDSNVEIITGKQTGVGTMSASESEDYEEWNEAPNLEENLEKPDLPEQPDNPEMPEPSAEPIPESAGVEGENSDINDGQDEGEEEEPEPFSPPPEQDPITGESPSITVGLEE